MVQHRLVEAETPTLDAFDQAVAAPENGYALSVLARLDGRSSVQAIEIETSAAQNVSVADELLESPVYANLRGAYRRLVELVGPPPFALGQGKKSRHALTFAGSATRRSTWPRRASSSRATRASAR